MSEYQVPLRVSFVGGALDTPDYIGYGTGISVCAAIDKYVHVEITTSRTNLPPYIEPECDFIRDLLDSIPFHADIPRMQIRWSSDIPLGSGLGGSSALLVAVSKHFFHNPDYQAYMASAVELHRGHGWQDSAICAWGGCRVFTYRHDGFMLSETLKTPDSNHFMLLSTGKFHDTSVQRGSIKQMDSDTFNEIKECNRLGIKALRHGDYETVGQVCSSVHEFKCQNPLYITNDMQDFLNESKEAGSFGGKLLGSGGGGHFLLVTNPDRRKYIRELAKSYGFNEIGFNFV